ncbi:LysR family transcriptional regulator [Bradyrhizobium cenepequi]|uniref:LysR family transcriptional regulator n=1 Tax=Bradyrhizobium cenepequi TaxID=2821403 RepID=UPI001CE34129|nr:LysR family transcriptional regulator [Bradyrhizobium cenepequi]MCA6112218.1 LysR family transcriptional regulator [Bradyrhizobium cenepequi]
MLNLAPANDFMDSRHLRYFVAAAEVLSFAKPARDLHMNQSPLSNRIADIELEVDVPLFDRSSKKVALAAADQGFLPQALAAVRAFDSVIRVARTVPRSPIERLGLHAA